MRRRTRSCKIRSLVPGARLSSTSGDWQQAARSIFVSSIDSEIPRPEYPRPQFVRSDWLNLNGRWQYRLDDDNNGLEQRWFAGKDYVDEIRVPFALECPFSGIGDRSFHPYIWYKRVFEVPHEWHGRCIRLNFGAVDYRATVWVNGIVVASHEGGHTPF